MKILYLNPVGTKKHDMYFADTLSKYKHPYTELHICSLSEKNLTTFIEYECSEICVSKAIMNAAYRAQQERFDAIIIGCFYDTALAECREICNDIIVIGPCQASIYTAMSIANNFSILLANRKSTKKISQNLFSYGGLNKLASFEYTSQSISDFFVDPNVTVNLFKDAAQRAVNMNYAEALILGCTLEAHFFEEISNSIDVPVVNPSIAALFEAEKLALLKHANQIFPSNRWTSDKPDNRFLSQFGIIDSDFEFGNRIILDSAKANNHNSYT